MLHRVERAVQVAASVLCLFVSGIAVHAAGATAQLEAGFAQPPASARPWVYYFIMDGNFTREGVTADFEALHRAGIGGLIFMEVDAGIPRGPVKFMSQEWRQTFKHAVTEAERLGLQVTLNAGPGWTGSGGPWVKPEQSMQHVVANAIEVTGPTNFDAIVSRPRPRAPYFGNAGLPEAMLKAKDDFYMDVAVLAVPSTSGAMRISDIDEKALYLRHPYSSRPGTKATLPALAAYPALPADAVTPLDRVVDLTARLGADGRLAWNVPEGKWTILRFGRTSTGANTRPAPAPGLGLECDKFDQAALDAHFDAFIGALLREIGPRKQSADAGWNMLHIDSWEMGAQNWTAAFRDEFRRRRGYDPVPYLPAVTGRVVQSLEVSERFLWDLRQTAQELTIQNHAEHLKELGRRHGFGLSIEPYDMNPCADMSLGAVADVPMCEFWLHGFNTFFTVIEAASIAHTCGRPIVAAESFTSDDSERWQAHPGSMKALGDWAFSAGVNRIVFHRSQHQPQIDHRPGMTMGPYGVHWERTQTWWEMVPAYHAYLARCQFLLRQGLPVADVAYLVAEGAPHVFRPPASATRGTPPERLGYNFDGCAPETLLQRMSVQDGRLVLPDGMSYRVLVLPERDTMTPTLLRKVKELVEAGATVIGPRPLKSPSLNGYPNCDNEVQKLASELWGACDGRTITENRFGKGRVVFRQSGAGEQAKSPLSAAKWIWRKEGRPASSAPVGKRYFRRTVMLATNAIIESARLFMTADNSFAVFVNRRPAGTGDNFHETYAIDVAPIFSPGTNVVTVEAVNGGDAPNPAGLIGALIIRLSGGGVIEVPTDRQWETALNAGNEPGSDSTAQGWEPALELGLPGMAPWNRDNAPAEAEQYGDFNHVVDVLSKMRVPLDFASDVPLRYTHRRAGETDIYFVANRDDRSITANCAFRVSDKAPELWDPMTGDIRALPEFTAHEGVTTVPLQFEPTQSFFVIFRKPGSSTKMADRNFPMVNKVAEISGAWDVAFDPKWGGPENVIFTSLTDWSTRPESGIKFYSGVATYRKRFELPSEPGARGSNGTTLYLDLGRVKNLARVRLNGRDLGVAWCPPWRVDITRAVKAGDNQLEIEVANLWPNRLIGDQSLPPEKRFTSTTWNPFRKSSRLLESGLLGPVTIQQSVASEKAP